MNTYIAVIGLGYVGLPLARLLATRYPVVGFDLKQERVQQLNQGVDITQELDNQLLRAVLVPEHPVPSGKPGLYCTSDPEALKGCNFFIVAVPTPVDEHNHPNLKPLLGASQTVGKALSPGDVVVYESTVYPGCTEEDCVPVLEEASGLKFPQDFQVGYSPERINPGDRVHTLVNTVKIVSGCDQPTLERVAAVYESVLENGVHRAPAIKVAEAAKIVENTQRDINIALMNELSIIFGRMGINTFDVIRAAGTKWNFLSFHPGLVGGHCIGVDPYYLTYKASQLGYHAQMIDAGRFVNDSMGGYIAKQTVKKLLAAGKNLHDSRVLVMGFTFKENVSDIRNSKVAQIVQELQTYHVGLEIVDPCCDPQEVMTEYGLQVSNAPTGLYDAAVVAVAHQPYRALTRSDLQQLLVPGGLLVDIKGILREQSEGFTYWSL